MPYIRGLSIRERVDIVLHELNGKHRWSIKDLVYNMVTAEPIKKNGVSCLVRAKALSDGIYQREEVVIASSGLIRTCVYFPFCMLARTFVLIVPAFRKQGLPPIRVIYSACSKPI